MGTYRVKIRPDLDQHQYDLRYDFLVTEDSVADVKANDDVEAAIEAVTEDFQSDSTMLKIYEWQGQVEDQRYYYQAEYSDLWKLVDRSAHEYTPDPLDTVIKWFSAATEPRSEITTVALDEITVGQANMRVGPPVYLYISGPDVPTTGNPSFNNLVSFTTTPSTNITVDALASGVASNQSITLGGETVTERMHLVRFDANGTGLTAGALPAGTVTATIAERTVGNQVYNTATTTALGYTGTVVAAPMEEEEEEEGGGG